MVIKFLFLRPVLGYIMDKQLNPLIEDDEPLARYIFSNSHFNKQRVKRQAFMPCKDKVSVIRHKECLIKYILEIGKQMEKSRRERLKVIASILTQDVQSTNGLDVESDTSDKQHIRHANIKNFHGYNDAKIRQLAQKLADKAWLLYRISDNQEDNG